MMEGSMEQGGGGLVLLPTVVSSSHVSPQLEAPTTAGLEEA